MIYEVKTYEAAPGRFEAMRDRFLAEARPRLEAHGIEVLAVSAQGGKLSYLTRAADEAGLAAGWAAFKADPGWQAVKEASERDGPLMAGQTSLILRETE
jgi:hypothetical protein